MLNLLYKTIYLMQLPYRDPSFITSLRLAKLRKLVAHAKNNVSFYREKFSNLETDDLRSLEDLKILPITRPIELRQARPENILATIYRQNDMLLQSTSGTSGMPFTFFNARQEDTFRQLKFIRFLYQHGWKPWWKGVNVWRETKKKKSSLFQRMINKKKYFVSISLPIKDQVQNILAIRPHFIYSMTASLDIIATWMLENNVNYNEVSLIITSGATLTPEISDKFRKVFGQPGIDMYSFVEGGFIGGDCHHCGLKYFDDDGCIVEVLDGNDQSVRTGEKGRVVITVLDQFSTPIIRYDIGDYITLPPRQIRCKNNFTHYLSTDGRQADTLILRGGRIIQYQHTSVLHKIQGLRQFQFLQKANDDIVIKYVRKPGFSQAEIQRIILEKTRLENHPGLYFQECDSIPLEPSGKFKRVKKQAANESDVGLPCS